MDPKNDSRVASVCWLTVLVRLPRCSLSGQHVPGLGPSGPGRTEAPSSGRQRRSDRRDMALGSILALAGVPGVSRGALRPRLGGAELAHDDLASQAGEGRSGPAPEACQNSPCPKLTRAQRGAPLDLERPAAKCARHLPRPLAGPLFPSSTVFGLYAARTGSVPPSGPVSYRAVASGGTNSYAGLTRGVSAPSAPNVAQLSLQGRLTASAVRAAVRAVAARRSSGATM